MTSKSGEGAMNGATYSVRLRDLEQRVDELKDQIRRSHTRLAMISDTILSGGAAGSRAELVFHDEMSSAFLLTQATFVMDNQVQYNKLDDSGALADQKEIPIYTGSVPPGDHTIQVALTFQGNGYGVFSYLRGYKFEVKSSHSFTAVEGKGAQRDRDGVREGRRDDSARAAAHGRVARDAEAADDGRRAADDARRTGRSARGWRQEVRFAPLGPALCGAVLVAAFAAEARGGPEESIASARGDLATVSHDIPGIQAAIDRAKADQRSPEERLANGELLYRTNDFRRAVVVLSEILEEFPNTPSYPDALWLRGETYYAAHDYLSARRDYAALVDHGAEPRFGTYFGRGLARLVDVSLRLDDPPETLAPIFEKFKLVPPAQIDAGLLYAKGKAYYRLGSWNDSTQAFSQVTAGTPYTHQARYFEGVIAMKLARLPGADAQAADRQDEGPHAVLPGDRSVPRRDGARARHARASARHRSGVDGDRALLLRDGAVREGDRGVLEGGPREPRVRYDALRARVGVRPPRGRPAGGAGARGPDDQRPE